MQESGLPGYRFLEVCVTYGGVRKLWVVIHSQAAEERELAAQDARIRRDAEKAKRELKQLARGESASEEALRAAVARKGRRWKYHTVEFICTLVPHYGQRGRPAKDAEPAWVGWRIGGWEIHRDEEAVRCAQARCGKFTTD
jgi:transposase